MLRKNNNRDDANYPFIQGSTVISAGNGVESSVLAGSGVGRNHHDNCPVCGNTDARVHIKRQDVLWMKCVCGIIYKKWSAESPSVPCSSDPAYGFYSTRWRRRVSKSRHQIRDVLNFVEKGALLDIGCSLGYTLVAARKLGMKAQGLEYDAGVAQYCRSRGYAVKTGTMTELPFDSGEFQIVTMKHVLEHTHEPKKALRDVWRVLKPGGGLFIAVPDGRYGKSVRNPYKSPFFELANGHCIYYTPDTMARLVTDCGFSVACVHPRLVHWSAPIAVVTGQLIALPVCWLVETIREAARIRKEFWLVAVKKC